MRWSGQNGMAGGGAEGVAGVSWRGSFEIHTVEFTLCSECKAVMKPLCDVRMEGATRSSLGTSLQHIGRWAQQLGGATMEAQRA